MEIAVDTNEFPDGNELEESRTTMSANAQDIEHWFQAQLDAAERLAKIGSRALQRRRTSRGEEALREAEAVLDMTEDETERSLKLSARVFNELGVVHQRQGELEESRDYHQRAALICDELLDRGVDFASNSAATHLNLSSIELALEDEDRARECGEKALRLLRDINGGDDDGPEPLELGAHQSLAVVYARQQDWEKANEAMEQAVDLADELVAAGNKSLMAQLTRGCQQLSVILFDHDRYDDALRWGRQAERLSEEAYEAIGRGALPIYITSQINLISYNEKLGRFADGEDCLWKALDVAGNDPRILQRGVAFYETCRKQADPRLEKGNLPRNEVEDGYQELKERVEDAGGFKEVRRKVRELRGQKRG